MSSQEFGDLLRLSRERLGLSASRVAELIGRAPSTVRAWEKGTSSPSDASVVSTLAAVLGIDEVVLFESAGFEPPVMRVAPTVRQALSTLTPSARESDAKTPERPAPRTPTPDPPRQQPPPTDEPRRAHVREPQPVPPPLTAPPAPTPPLSGGAQAGSTQSGAQARHRAGGQRTSLILDRLRGATVRRPPAVVAPTTLPPLPRTPSYMEEPAERWSYRLRSIYTAGGVLALFIALGWAATNLLDALGSVWEIFTSNL